MTLSHGRDLFLTPGPSVMPDSVLAAMMRPAPNIYGGPLVDVTKSIVADLKTIAGTAHQGTIYIANGHGIWEAAIANVFAPGDLALQEAAKLIFDLPERPKEKAFREMARDWAPWRSVAARIMWAYYKQNKQREGIT